MTPTPSRAASSRTAPRVKVATPVPSPMSGVASMAILMKGLNLVAGYAG